MISNEIKIELSEMMLKSKSRSSI